MDIYFSLWVRIHDYRYLFCCSSVVIPDLAFGSSFILTPVPFNMCPYLLSTPYVLALLDVPGNCVVLSHHPVLSVLVLAPTISPKNPASFYWRIVFRNQGLGARYRLLLLAAP